MTVSTLRPNGTTTFSGSAAVTGAASAHAALNDDSDSSYIVVSNDGAWRGDFDDLSLPSGAVLKSLAVRARTARPADTPGGAAQTQQTELVFGAFTDEKSTYVLVNWTSPTTVTLIPAQAVTALGSALTDAIADGIQVRFDSTNNRIYEAYVDVVYVEKPEITDVTPTGTVENTNIPTIDWGINLDPDGGPQAAAQLAIFEEAVYTAGGFNPNTSTALERKTLAGTPTSYQLTTILPNGTYRAYVRTRQTAIYGNQLISDWEYSEFEIDVAVPAVPTLDVEADNENARHILVITDQPGDADTHYWEVERSTDGGATWAPMRQLVPGLFHTFGQSLTLYDYEAPPFPVGTQLDHTLPIPTATQYRARGLHDYSGVLAAGEWAFNDAAWSTADWWLKHPNRPDLNVRVTVHSYASIKRSARQGVLQPLGARFPVVISDTRGPATAQIVLRSDTAGDQAALDALLETHGTLLLQGPANEKPPGYIAIGDHDRQRWVDLGRVSEAREVLEFTIVDRPPGNVVAWP